MKILLDHNLDHNVDWRLKRLLPNHQVRSAKEMGWERWTNGQLLSQADRQFDVMLTVDRNIKHQQNLVGLQISIIVLIAATNTRAALTPLMPEVETLLSSLEPGRLYEVALGVTLPITEQAHEHPQEPRQEIR